MTARVCRTPADAFRAGWADGEALGESLTDANGNLTPVGERLATLWRPYLASPPSPPPGGGRGPADNRPPNKPPANPPRPPAKALPASARGAA